MDMVVKSLSHASVNSVLHNSGSVNQSGGTAIAQLVRFVVGNPFCKSAIASWLSHCSHATCALILNVCFTSEFSVRSLQQRRCKGADVLNSSGSRYHEPSRRNPKSLNPDYNKPQHPGLWALSPVFRGLSSRVFHYRGIRFCYGLQGSMQRSSDLRSWLQAIQNSYRAT